MPVRSIVTNGKIGFLLKLKAVGLISIGTGCVLGGIAVAVCCSVTIAFITGILAAGGVAFAGYHFFLAESAGDDSAASVEMVEV